MSIAFHSSEAAASVEDVARRLSSHELKRVQEFFSAGDQLDQFARELQFESELDVLCAIGRSLSIPVVDLSKEEIDDSILKGFPVRLVHRHGVFPIACSDASVKLAISNPFDVQAADAVAEATGLFVRTVLALPHEVATLIKSHLGVGAETLEGLMAQAAEESDGLEVIGDLEFDESEAAAMAQ